MKKFFVIIIFFTIVSCSHKLDRNPLVIPPNFAEIPDKNNPEQIPADKKQEDVARLKELLLKSDE